MVGGSIIWSGCRSSVLPVSMIWLRYRITICKKDLASYNYLRYVKFQDFIIYNIGYYIL